MYLLPIVLLVFAQAQAAPAKPSALDAAETLIEQHDYAKARDTVMQALTASPNDTRALYDLGFIEFATDHTKEAEQDYRRVIELAPALPEAHLALGRLLAQTDRKEEARQQFSLVSQDTKAAGNLRGEAWRARANLDLDSSPAEARQDLLNALQVSAELPQDTMLTGRLGEALGDLDTAAQAYRKLLKDNQLTQPATEALGRVLLKQHSYADAVTLLQPAHQQFADDMLITAQLASGLANTGKEADALPLLEQAHAADPTMAPVTRMLADIENTSGHPEEAESLYVGLLKYDAKDPGLLEEYGNSLVRQKRYFEAVPPLQQAVGIKPDMPDVWGSLAFANYKLQKPEDVLADLTERKKYLADDATTYFLWATAYDKLRRTKQAEDYYRRFLDASGGKFPDQEFQVRHRLAAMEHNR